MPEFPPANAAAATASTPVATAGLKKVRGLWPRSLLAAFIAFGFLASAFWLFRAPILRGAALLWVVNDPLQKADVIVVLGGGLETRPFAAAKLFHEGFASRILILNPSASPAAVIGVLTPEGESTRRILIKLGVPDSAVLNCSPPVSSTYEESRAVRGWVETNAVKRLLIPTDSFHTRRVAWLFRKQLGAAHIEVVVRPVPAREYTLEDWWKKEQGLTAFQNELIKYAYYRFAY